MLTDVSIVDRLPAGFTYVAGSALLDGVPTEPSVAGRTLSWNGLAIAGTQVRTLRLLLAVGAGVTEGEYVNRAQVVNGVTGNAMSGEATATVRVVPDPTFDCTDVTGKVFNDANRNGRAGRRRRRPARRACGDSARSAGDDRSVRAVPHHLRDHAT